jgi:hypothetical protein
MKEVFNYVLGVAIVLFVLSLGIKSCVSIEVCDNATGEQCFDEPSCQPLLFSLIGW